MLSENKFNMLLQRVVFDHEILTHRVVARSFKVDTTTAKKILGEFVQRSDGRAHATYILTGFIKNGAPPASGQSAHSLGSAPSGLLTSSNESQANGLPTAANGDVAMANGDDQEDMPSSSAPQAGPSSLAYVTELRTQEEKPIDQFECVMLVPQEELQEKLPLFSTLLSQEVYSAEPSRLPDLVLLTDANAPVLKDMDLAAIEPDVLGTIKHYRSNVKKSGKSGKVSTVASTSASTLDKNKDKAKGKDTSNSKTDKEKLDLKRKASTADLKSENAAKSASSSKAPSPAATTKDKGKEKAASSRTSGPSLNDLFKSDSGTKKASTSDAKKLTKQPSKQADAEEDFDDMLADDDDMMAEIDALDNKTTSKPSSQKLSEPSSSQNKKDEGKGYAEKKEKVTLQSGSRRKIRKVKKQIQEVNAKGYKVTKEVETEEEYTASDSDDDGPVVASASAPASKAAKETKETKEKEKEKPKAKEKPAEKAKLEKKPSFSKTGSSSSQAKPKAGTGGQTSLAGFFGKPKPKK